MAELKIVVIAYKSNSSDYCRGCLMDSYSSDFEMEEFDNEDDAAEFIADILFRNEQLQTNESGYTVEVVYGTWDKSSRFEKMAEPHLSKKIESHREVVEKREKEEEKRKLKEIEKRERKTLVELKNKYEGDINK